VQRDPIHSGGASPPRVLDVSGENPRPCRSAAPRGRQGIFCRNWKDWFDRAEPVAEEEDTLPQGLTERADTTSRLVYQGQSDPKQFECRHVSLPDNLPFTVCAGCGQVMKLIRSVPRLGTVPELHVSFAHRAAKPRRSEFSLNKRAPAIKVGAKWFWGPRTATELPRPEDDDLPVRRRVSKRVNGSRTSEDDPILIEQIEPATIGSPAR
jgi:hypothetical protein